MYKYILSIIITLLLITPCFGQIIAHQHFPHVWEMRAPENFSTTDDGTSAWLGYYAGISRCTITQQADYDDNLHVLVLGDSLTATGTGAVTQSWGCSSIGHLVSASLGVKVDIEVQAGALFWTTGSCALGMYRCGAGATITNSLYGLSPHRYDYDWIIINAIGWDIIYHNPVVPNEVACWLNDNNETGCTYGCSRFIKKVVANVEQEEGRVYTFIDDMQSENSGVKIIFVSYYTAFGAYDTVQGCVDLHLNPRLKYIAEDPASTYKDNVFYVDSDQYPNRTFSGQPQYFRSDGGHPQYLYRKEIAEKIMDVINAN